MLSACELSPTEADILDPEIEEFSVWTQCGMCTEVAPAWWFIFDTHGWLCPRCWVAEQ